MHSTYVVDFNVASYLNDLNILLLMIRIKQTQRFWDKYNIKLYEHTTALTSAVHNLYESKQNRVLVYLWNSGTIRFRHGIRPQ